MSTQSHDHQISTTLETSPLREHMSLITSAFLKALDVEGTEMIDWNSSNENDITEVTQLRIPLAGELLPV